MRTIERRRYQQNVWVKAKRADSEATIIQGYGAVFYNPADPGTEFQLWDGVYERIGEDAFTESLGRDDVRSFFNHNEDLVLGRTSTGTLTLAVDDRGLFFTVTPPDTPTMRDLVVAPIERGDVDGASFMFVPTQVTWSTEVEGKQERDIRTVEAVELWEVGPVALPAYESATSGVRSGVRSCLASTESCTAVGQEWLAYRASLAKEKQEARQRVARALELELELLDA